MAKYHAVPLSKFESIKSNLDVKKFLPLAVIIVLVIAAIVYQATVANKDDAFDAYQDQLQSQVETEDGAPRDGRDPSSQQQSTLSAASSNPTANNTEKTSGQLSDPEKTGLNSAGCYYDYGEPGQCVAAHAATNGKLTCEGVKTHGGFPNGVKISGTDRFKLDKNGDGIACNPGD